jgi:hypothetical protein
MLKLTNKLYFIIVNEENIRQNDKFKRELFQTNEKLIVNILECGGKVI